MPTYPDINLAARLTTLSGNHEHDRNSLRKIVIDCFIAEHAGTGRVLLTSKYKYYVETLSSGHRIYLSRPAILYKGFDFLIHVENQGFRSAKTPDSPSHDDILDDIKAKKSSNLVGYKELVLAIEEVYSCHDARDVFAKYQAQLSQLIHGLSPEMIIKTIKWFFIEQDINFWNWSGRAMFMNAIRKI